MSGGRTFPADGLSSRSTFRGLEARTRLAVQGSERGLGLEEGD